MSVIYGYARVSSVDQDLTLQEEALRSAGQRSFSKRRKAAPRQKAEKSFPDYSISFGRVTPSSLPALTVSPAL